MPDFDSGHIFLTTLAPVKDGTCAIKGHGHWSWRQRLRNALVELPVAHQSPATVDTGLGSPFARNQRTHLARMFVLDDVVYNGREGHDAIKSSIKALAGDKDAGNPALPQHIDYLNCSYLVFCADIDAVTRTGDPLPATLSKGEQEKVRRTYAEELWTTMGEELAAIYSNCHGFDGVTDAKGFADYLERCHVQTTMPFHDYYIMPQDQLLKAFNRLPLKPLAAAVLLPAAVACLAFLLALFTEWDMPLVGGNPIWTMIIAGALACVAFILSVRYAIRNGEKPLPPAQYDDLRSVLKGLYIQQKFSDFVIDMQGETPEAIHAAFGIWLALHAPDDLDGPTQAPGVIRSPSLPTEPARATS
ncbi:hypothetical protein [Sagittula sp. S175]|uniref:hypothetical protein n=1 Tax=Sagittula sp. S175 TaxID=3415129 RepID=UPI003C7A7DB9